MSEQALFERLDKIISLLEEVAKSPSLFERILQGGAAGVGIMGIISVIDVIKSWFGG